ncbi:MAG: hypothetical protein U9N45_03860, partial [Gemmatimonadota bacterium]|nr:hypothetical protein [Gemmatimonadota bacterium]
NRKASPKQTLRVVRAMTFVAGAMGIVFAFLIPLIGENVVAAYLTVVGVFDMPFFVIAIVFGLLWRRANWQGVLTGYLAGIVAGCISAYLRGMDAFFFSTFVSTATVLAVTPIATMFFPKQSDEQLDRVWAAHTHSDEEHEGEPFHIVPDSGWGKLFLTLFFLGLGAYLFGVISASTGFAHASAVAFYGMVLYFLSGLARLAFD